MSSAAWADEETYEEVVDFLRRYYKEEIQELALAYPKDSRSLHIDYNDLFTFNPEHADRFVSNRTNERGETVLDLLEAAIQDVDQPVNNSFESRSYADPHVRIALPEEHTLGVGAIRDEHRGRRVAITGQIERVTQPETRFESVTFVCQRCGYETSVPQSQTDFQEPYECESCERQGPFQIDEGASETVDHVAMKVKQPPEASSGDGAGLMVYVEDDLLNVGERKLTDCSGERVKVSGLLRYDLSQMDGQNARALAGEYLEAETIEFTGNTRKDINIEEHREEFMELADREDAFELLRDSIAPNLYGGRRLQQVLEGAVLFLFGGYRKPTDGATYRGDIHLLAVGDPGTGKSTIAANVAELSPHCEQASGTNVTGVGLTASATRDEDFGGDSWALKPGVLPKAHGGHAVLDEIDKMPGDASKKLHEALEDQRLNVSKAGMSATLRTEAGLFTAGNPVHGRFDYYQPVSEQIDIDPALFSRFDLIFVMLDRPDEDLDRDIASHMLESWREAGEQTRAGDDATVEGEATSRPVSADVFRAWVAYARQNIEPSLPEGEVADRLREFYTEHRQPSEDSDDPGITVRKLEAGLRLAEASARAHLREEIVMEDVERAIDLTKRMIGDVNTDSSGQIHADYTEAPKRIQGEAMDALRSVLRDLEPEHSKGVPQGVLRSELEEHRHGDPDRLDDDLETLKRKGSVYEPSSGCYRLTGD